jgi:hypothetical protein
MFFFTVVSLTDFAKMSHFLAEIKLKFECGTIVAVARRTRVPGAASCLFYHLCSIRDAAIGRCVAQIQSTHQVYQKT